MPKLIGQAKEQTYRETLNYFRRICDTWTIRDSELESVIDGIASELSGHRMTWCHFELLRDGEL